MCLTIDIKPKEDILTPIIKELNRIIVPKKATKNIKVIKLIRLGTSSTYFSVHNSFQYEKGKIYTEPNFLIKDIQSLAERGVKTIEDYNSPMYSFHRMWLEPPTKLPYERKLTAKEWADKLRHFDVNHGFHSWKDKPAHIYPTVDQVFAEFIIPKGSKYFEHDNNYVSQKIKFVDLMQ